VPKETIALFSLFGVGALLVMLVGFYSLLTTRSLIRVMISVELLSKSVMLLLIAAGNAVHRTALAQAMAITLINIEVAVVVVAVGIILCVFRQHKTVDKAVVQEIRG
jgi:NADH:ubiquinone oxidoreductase subunit K